MLLFHARSILHNSEIKSNWFNLILTDGILTKNLI